MNQDAGRQYTRITSRLQRFALRTSSEQKGVSGLISPADNVIDMWCRENKINVFRGSETDVLSRFVGTANVSEADVILRITADEPFVDPRVIGEVVRLQKQTGADYCSNVHPRTYGDG